MGLKVADVQPTPNPNAMKFVLDRQIWDRPISFFSADAACGHSLAAKLFAIPGVSGVLLLADFVTVSKTPRASWASIKKNVRKVLETASPGKPQ
jgi:hypothetical protein